MCTTASCSDGQIINTETSLAQTANLQSVYTNLGFIYYNRWSLRLTPFRLRCLST